MSVSSIFILDDKGSRLLYRDFRGNVDPKCIEVFEKRICDPEYEASLKPVFKFGENNYIFMKFESIYLVAVSCCNVNAMTVLNFLRSFVKILEECLGKLEYRNIINNSVFVIELLDEAIDFGFPQVTEPKLVKSCVSYSIFDRPLNVAKPAVTRNISWRADGLKYRKNEIFVDVVEKVNLLANSKGKVLTNDIYGVFLVKACLSGIPDIKLGFNDQVLLKTADFEQSAVRSSNRRRYVDLHDIKFHQCVRLDAFEKDRLISFIPPDGEFDLLTYRVDLQTRPPFWVDAQVTLVSGDCVDYNIYVKSCFGRDLCANFVELRVNVPKDSFSAAYKTSNGNFEYKPEEDCLIWNLKAFNGQKEATLHAKFNIPSISSENFQNFNAKVNINFEINNYTCSGVKVRYLKVVERSGYRALAWIRYITQNGSYEFRT